MKTYPAMNKEIVELLRSSKQPHHLYAAQRIEELEEQSKALAFELTTSALRNYKTCKRLEAKIDKLQNLIDGLSILSET